MIFKNINGLVEKMKLSAFKSGQKTNNDFSEREIFLKLATRVAIADGPLNGRELRIINEICGGNTVERDVAAEVIIASREKNNSSNTTFYKKLSKDYLLARKIMQKLYEVAAIDGILNTSERSTLNAIGESIGLQYNYFSDNKLAFSAR